MKKVCAGVFFAVFGFYFCTCGAFAKEKLFISAQLDEMPSEVQSSDTFVKQLYVGEKKDFDNKVLEKKIANKPVPLYKYKKLAPSAEVQKKGIEIVLE